MGYEGQRRFAPKKMKGKGIGSCILQVTETSFHCVTTNHQNQ
jgi:hypothetical protein